MSQIGTIAAGVGIETTFNLQFVPEFIKISDTEDDLLISAISWNIAGKERVVVSGADFVDSMMSFRAAVNVAGVSTYLQKIMAVSDGYQSNQQFQLRITNNTAGALPLYGFSKRRGSGVYIMGAQTVILNGANQRFSGFSSLIMPLTNVSRADVTFKDWKTGATFTDTFLPQELRSLYMLEDYPTTGGGISDGDYVAIDNTNLYAKVGLFIDNVTIYAAGANVTVLVNGLSS